MADSRITSDRLDPLRGAYAREDEEEIGQRFEARRLRRGRLMRWALAGVVVAPTAIAGLYFGLWAAPRYVSETQFMVRTIGSVQVQSGSGLMGLLQAFGTSATLSPNDSNAVVQYLESRDAVSSLEAALPLREIYAREEADAVARFPRPFFGDSFEWLYWYYKDRMAAWLDTDTGIITVQAQAFRPKDAQMIARQLLSQAEMIVNEMNLRLEADTVRTAEVAVAEAEKVVLATQEDVDRFRGAESVVDPTQNAVAQLGTITDLAGQVDQVLAQLARNKKLSPSNPTIADLKAKAEALSAQIAVEQKGLAGPSQAVSNKVSAYEHLTLLRRLADASLTTARASLDDARNDARRQHVFIEQIAKPNLPDYSAEPQRLRSIAAVFAISMTVFSIAWLLSTGVHEHRR